MKCLECDRTDIKARGLCWGCYTIVRDRGDLDRYVRTRMVNAGKMCKKCNEHPAFVKLMCKLCYFAAVRAKSICLECEKYKSIHARGVCKQCHYKDNFTMVICVKCGTVSKHRGRGLCHSCYRAPKRICKRCGQERIIRTKEMCGPCHDTETGLGIIRTQRYNARKDELGATLTQDEWKLLLHMTDNRCLYCGEQSNSLEQEHWIPVIKGGSYTYSNIVPACRSCNASKHTMTGPEYLSKIGMTLVFDIHDMKQFMREEYVHAAM